MRVQVIANRRDPSARLAFLHYLDMHGEMQSAPGYFDKKLAVQPLAGSEVEAMISGVLYHKDATGQFFDFHKPKCFFLTPPQEHHIKVWYDGFECSGSGCTTTARAYKILPNGTMEKNGKTMTPGKLMSSLIVADNTSNAFYGKPSIPPTPGFGWAERHPQNTHLRLAGVEEVKYLNIHIKEDQDA